MARRWTVVCSLLALSLLLSAPIAAIEDGRTPVGTDIRISGPYATQDDDLPAVAHNTFNNQYLVVWSDSRGPNPKIYGRRLKADLTPIGGDFRISATTSPAAETAPDVAWDATHNTYLVVWGDDRNEVSRGRDIYGRRVKPNGTFAGAEFRISGKNAMAHEFTPAVAWHPSSAGYLVVWVDGRNFTARSFDIYGRLVTADGKVPFAEMRISGPNATAYDDLPDVAAGTSAFLVVWEDQRNFDAGNGTDIYARRVASTGGLLGGDFRVNGFAGSSQVLPAVAWNDQAKQYLVVWQDGRNLGTTNLDIYGRRVKADGTRLAGDIRMTADPAAQYRPDVAWNKTWNRYLVVWEDWRDYATSGGDTYARRVGADGSRIGGNFRVSGTGAVSHENDTAVVYNQNSNQFLVVWSDWRNRASRGDDIFGRRVTG